MLSWVRMMSQSPICASRGLRGRMRTATRMLDYYFSLSML